MPPKDDFDADNYVEKMKEAEKAATAEDIASINRAIEAAKKATDDK